MNHKLTPSSVGKDDALPLLSYIFEASLLQRKDLIMFLEAVEYCSVLSQPLEDFDKHVSDDILSLIASPYEFTFKLGEKEAAGALVVTNFLLAAVQLLCSSARKIYYLDPEFVVFKMANTENPDTDMANVVSSVAKLFCVCGKCAIANGNSE